MLLHAAVWAAVEQTPVPCLRGYCLWERPTLTAPPGWILDRSWSERLQQSVYVPQATDYAGAPVSMIARATERRHGQGLQAFLQEEQDRLIGTSLSVAVTALAPLRDAVGKRWPATRLAPRPGRSGAVQSVVVIEDGPHFVVLLLSTQDAALHRRHWADFQALVRSYRPQAKSI